MTDGLLSECPYPRGWDPIDHFYGELGLTTLRVAIETGAIFDVPDEELQQYANVAAVYHHGDVGTYTKAGGDTIDMNVELREYFLLAFMAIVSGDGITTDATGEPWIESITGEPMMLTPSRTQHIEWMTEVLSFPEAARNLLAVVPSYIRERAVAQALEASSMDMQAVADGWEDQDPAT